jgi:hypothetical protein
MVGYFLRGLREPGSIPARADRSADDRNSVRRPGAVRIRGLSAGGWVGISPAHPAFGAGSNRGVESVPYRQFNPALRTEGNHGHARSQ